MYSIFDTHEYAFHQQRETGRKKENVFFRGTKNPINNPVGKNQHHREGNKVAMIEVVEEKVRGRRKNGGRETERATRIEAPNMKPITNPAFSQKIGIAKIVVENNVLHSIEHNPDVLGVGCTCEMYV